MSKQTENYIGSQQHWEDRINDDYDYQKQMEKKMEKDVEKQIYKTINNKISESSIAIKPFKCH